ncbi:MAG: PD40 domain-containing protein [Ectothiorhodospiraceae bacterium]|nr:PD40 domain-containing protein [Ectothiorhodospiraceae bacterium]
MIQARQSFYRVSLLTVSLALLVMLGSQAVLAATPPTRGGPDAFGYFYADSNDTEGPTYDFVDITATGTSLVLSDDDVESFTIPFNFNFYGVDYNTVYVSSNGFISFDSGVDDGCCSGKAVATDDDVSTFIAAWWEDLNPDNGPSGINPGQGNNVFYEVQGTAPNRVVIVEFFNVPHYDDEGTNRFEYKLFESTNIIEVHYAQLFGDGGTTSAGIEDATQTTGLQYYLDSGDNGLLDLTLPFAVRYQTGVLTQSFNFNLGDEGFTTEIIDDAQNNWALVTQSAGTDPATFPSQVYGVLNQGNLGTEHSALVSPVLDLSNTFRISFESYVSNENGTYDNEYFEISTDGGATWTELTSEEVNPQFQVQRAWETINVVVPMGLRSVNGRLRFRYDTVDGCCGPTNIFGWYIDNINLFGLAGVSASNSTIGVAPGTEVIHTITINNGTDDDTLFDITDFSLSIFTVSHPATVFVAGNSSVTFDVSVTVPDVSTLIDSNDSFQLQISGAGLTAFSTISTNTDNQLTNRNDGFDSQALSISKDNSTVVFHSRSDLTGDNPSFFLQIFKVDTDGSNLMQVTPNDGVDRFSSNPSINADASLIVFQSRMNPFGTNNDLQDEIFVYDVAGADFTQLTQGSFGRSSVSPQISADTNRVVYSSSNTGTLQFEIFSINVNGGSLRQLTQNNNNASSWPSISDDGARVVFESRAHMIFGAGNVVNIPDYVGVLATNEDNSSEIFAINDDGSDLRQLTYAVGIYSDSYRPRISGDGQKLVFYSNADFDGSQEIIDNQDGTDEIFGIDFDGMGLTQLSNTNRDSRSPRNSFDGSIVTFQSAGDVLGDESNIDGQNSVFAADLDNGGLLQLSMGGDDLLPTISSDGEQIVYSSNSNFLGRNALNNYEVFLVYLNGREFDGTMFVSTNIQQLTVMQINIPGVDDDFLKRTLDGDTAVVVVTSTTGGIGSSEPMFMLLLVSMLAIRRRFATH